MSESQIKVKLNPDVKPAGSDLSIVNAARRSFNTRSEWDYTCECGIKKVPEAEYNKWPGCGADNRECNFRTKIKGLKPKDKRLLEFLARGMTADDFEQFVSGSTYWGEELSLEEITEKLWEWRNTPTHDTPFNHTFISFEVQAPIFVRAQLVKHEYLILSEFSRRYITDNVEFYTPDIWRNQSENKKQGEHPLFNHGKGTGYRGEEVEHNEDCLAFYHRLVEMGVAIEQSRMVLPQNVLTEWTWSGTLGAFAKMCTLRLHPEAQYEARLVAQQVYEYLKEYWPVGAKALVEGPDV
jgi:thymidylate synthase (FAD)